MFYANGLTCAVNFVRLHSLRVHRDAVQPALNLIGRICARAEIPANALAGHVEKHTALLSHSMQFVSDGALRCYQNLLHRGSCGESLANPATVDFFSTRLRSLVCHLETASFADRLAVSSSSSSSSSGPQQVGVGSDRGAGGSAGLHRSANLRRDRTVSALFLPMLTDPGRSSASVTAIATAASSTQSSTPITGSLESKVTAILNVPHSLSTGSPSVSERLLNCDSMLDVFVVELFAKDEACVSFPSLLLHR